MFPLHFLPLLLTAVLENITPLSHWAVNFLKEEVIKSVQESKGIQKERKDVHNI